MPTPDPTLLDRAIAQAREVALDPAEARVRARELLRTQHARAPRGTWWWMPALAVAMAIAAIVWWPRSRDLPPVAADVPIQVGTRVAIVASPGADYAIRNVAADATQIEVISGSVTARLYPGPAPHRLALTAGDVEAAATGTSYTLTVPRAGAPYVEVHDGTVAVREHGTSHAVAAGQRWPTMSPTAPGVATAAASLARHVLPLQAVTPIVDAGVVDALAPDAAPAPPPAERWRHARRLRGQGATGEALAILDELAAGGDPTWAPLALAEAMRIYTSERPDPRAVQTLAAAFRRRYPAHALAREVTELECRALRASGATELPAACVIQ